MGRIQEFLAKQPKPLIPEWRYWPACWLAVLLAVAIVGYSSAPAPHAIARASAPYHQQKHSNASKDDDPSFLLLVAQNHDVIESIASVGAVLAAVWLAFVTSSLFRATRDLATSTEDLADGAAQQVAEMILARELAERQHDLAEKQFLLAGRQCDLADKQFGLQRLQWLAEHRPRIKIRSIGISRVPHQHMLEESTPIVGSLVIWNDGAADATILSAEYRFFTTNRQLPMVPPLNEHAKSLLHELPFRLDGFGSHLVPIENVALGPRAKSIIQGGGECLYLMGAIKYQDGDLKERCMGFCRKYERPIDMGGDGRFIPIENPDYEYSD